MHATTTADRSTLRPAPPGANPSGLLFGGTHTLTALRDRAAVFYRQGPMSLTPFQSMPRPKYILRTFTTPAAFIVWDDETKTGYKTDSRLEASRFPSFTAALTVAYLLALDPMWEPEAVV